MKIEKKDVERVISRLSRNLKTVTGSSPSFVFDRDGFGNNNLRYKVGDGYGNLSIENTGRALYDQISLANKIIESFIISGV